MSQGEASQGHQSVGRFVGQPACQPASQSASLSDAVLCDVTQAAIKAQDDAGRRVSSQLVPAAPSCLSLLRSSQVLPRPPRPPTARSVLQARRQVSRLARERDGLARCFLTWPRIVRAVCVYMHCWRWWRAGQVRRRGLPGSPVTSSSQRMASLASRRVLEWWAVHAEAEATVESGAIGRGPWLAAIWRDEPASNERQKTVSSVMRAGKRHRLV